MCRQKHARQVAQLEQLLQAREADLQSLQAVVDSTQQTADAQHTQQIDSLRMSLGMSATQHRQQLEDEVGQINRLHMLQVIYLHLKWMQVTYAGLHTKKPVHWHCARMHGWVNG